MIKFLLLAILFCFVFVKKKTLAEKKYKKIDFEFVLKFLKDDDAFCECPKASFKNI